MGEYEELKKSKTEDFLIKYKRFIDGVEHRQVENGKWQQTAKK